MASKDENGTEDGYTAIPQSTGGASIAAPSWIVALKVPRQRGVFGSERTSEQNWGYEDEEGPRP